MNDRRALFLVIAVALFGAGFATGYTVRPRVDSAPIDSIDAAPVGGGEGASASATSEQRGDGGVAALAARDRRAGGGAGDSQRGAGGVAVVGGEQPGAPGSSGGGAETSSSGERSPLFDGGAPPTGRLDAAAIRDVVREHRDRLGFCFSWQLHSHPELHGRITMEFTIGEDGTVTRAEVLNDQLGDETVLNCFRNETRRMRFPRPEDGEVTVHYPFILAATDDSESDDSAQEHGSESQH